MPDKYEISDIYGIYIVDISLYKLYSYISSAVMDGDISITSEQPRSVDCILCLLVRAERKENIKLNV